jgi:hypothetical protein
MGRVLATIQAPDQHGAIPVNAGAGPADSLIADSLISEISTPDTNGSGSPHQVDKARNGDVRERALAIYDAAFPDFISDWPHQVNLTRAERIWKEKGRSSPDPHKLQMDIFAGKARYQASDQWARGVYDGPDKWLLNEKWRDHPAPKRSSDSEWTKVAQGENQ